MLTGFYGGTFDPVHLGHVHAATTVRDALSLDKVHLVLSARPGHRGQPQSPIQQRWAMLQLACAETPGLAADDRELRRAGPSYTLMTLEALHADDPQCIPCWVMGQDAFATLPEWYRWEELLSFCNLVVLDRPGDRRVEPDAIAELCARYEVSALSADIVGQIVRLQLPMLEVSATEIRRRIRHGESVSHLLADPVYTYIKQHDLYDAK